MAMPTFLRSRRWMLLLAALVIGLLVERVVAKAEVEDEPSATIRTDGAVIPPGWPGAAPSVGESTSTAAAAPTAATPAGAGTAMPVLQLDRLEGRDADARADAAQPIVASLFERPRARPSAVVVAAPPPAPPSPPPVPRFPYPYLGGLSDEGQRTAWFGKGDRVLAVQAGDTVDGVYRVEQLTTQHMKLTYLPLQQTLELSLGEAR